MKIYIASDHAGFALKEELKPYIQSLGDYKVKDIGPFTYLESDDYPDFCAPVAEAVASDWKNIKEGNMSEEEGASRGVVIGGSSIGEAIVSNRFHGVRAFGYYGGPIDSIKLSREHNDTNILALGARLLNPEEAMYAVKIWLSTVFPGEERHVRRIEKIDKMDS